MRFNLICKQVLLRWFPIPIPDKKLQFIEERVKTWVSEVIEGQDGISVQANLLSQKVDGLIGKLDD